MNGDADEHSVSMPLAPECVSDACYSACVPRNPVCYPTDMGVDLVVVVVSCRVCRSDRFDVASEDSSECVKGM